MFNASIFASSEQMKVSTKKLQNSFFDVFFVPKKYQNHVTCRLAEKKLTNFIFKLEFETNKKYTYQFDNERI